MEEQLTYIKSKIIKSKAHIACSLLKETSLEDLQAYLVFSMDTIQQHFARNSMRGNKSYQGEANLTHLSVAIGTHILDQINYSNKDDAPWDWFKLRVMMGDLFLEPFYQTHQINIGKTRDNEFIPIESLDRSLKRSRAHYIVVPEKWDLLVPEGSQNLLRGTVFEKPEPIAGLMQPTERPVIKGWTQDRSKEFKPYLINGFIKSMNVLQQTEWKINTKIKDILNRNRTKILDQYKDFPKKYKSKIIEFDLTMARSKLIGDKPFYQYTEADYRGRVYYTTPFLNFQGNDIARGQMLFAKGKLMTEAGLRRLKIHIACCYNETYSKNNLPNWLTTNYLPYLQDEELDDISVDKMTLEDREGWTDNNIEMLMTMADKEIIDPNAEKPISLLASVLEIKDALDKEEYITYLPIPIDGSNNGWQHLCAMSKDKEAGELVGIVPQDIQKDFYVQCAKDLIKRVPDWFEERQMPMKHIRKGIAKRGSMTRAYSAGAQKIAENMYLDCHVEGYLEKYNITEEDCELLAKHLIKAIDEVCAGPLQTMKFLQKIAEAEIASDYAKYTKQKSIRWTTPSGFPVIYEAFVENEFKEKAIISCSERKVKPILTKEDGTKEETDTIRIQHVGKEPTDKPKIRSFMSGISPNFVHSMDATHMSKVIAEWDGDFGAVHDSFSVHACDVDELLYLIKNKFIEMYSYPNFFEVIERMIVTNPDNFNYNQPELGSLDIREVKDSEYFFA
tara:strand:- start:5354 stop:7543 length:2190 start_codon:yes stop_codon:yes gene_type:complete